VLPFVTAAVDTPTVGLAEDPLVTVTGAVAPTLVTPEVVTKLDVAPVTYVFTAFSVGTTSSLLPPKLPSVLNSLTAVPAFKVIPPSLTVTPSISTPCAEVYSTISLTFKDLPITSTPLFLILNASSDPAAKNIVSALLLDENNLLDD
jgi:hypothetical protein